MDFELRTGEDFENGLVVAEGSAAHVFFDPKTDEVKPRPDWFLPAVAELENRPEESFVPEGTQLERRELGRSGVEIPAVGLGTWQVLEVRGREAGQGPRRRRDALLVRGFSDLRSVMRRGWVDLVQVPYNAAKTAVAEELLPLAQELGLGVIVASP